MNTRWLDTLCYWVCLGSLAPWVVLSVMLIWDKSPTVGGSRLSIEYSPVWKWWLTCQVVFIASALILRLNKTYYEKRPEPLSRESDEPA